jgi:hypothetical protein
VEPDGLRGDAAEEGEIEGAAADSVVEVGDGAAGGGEDQFDLGLVARRDVVAEDRFEGLGFAELLVKRVDGGGFAQLQVLLALAVVCSSWTLKRRSRGFCRPATVAEVRSSVEVVSAGLLSAGVLSEIQSSSAA